MKLISIVYKHEVSYHVYITDFIMDIGEVEFWGYQFSLRATNFIYN